MANPIPWSHDETRCLLHQVARMAPVFSDTSHHQDRWEEITRQLEYHNFARRSPSSCQQRVRELVAGFQERGDGAPFTAEVALVAANAPLLLPPAAPGLDEIAPVPPPFAPAPGVEEVAPAPSPLPQSPGLEEVALPPPPAQPAIGGPSDMKPCKNSADIHLLVQLSQWKKGRFLGSGSFGQVYLGVNSENGQFCAIKEVLVGPDHCSNEKMKQLNKEIDMLSRLSHPNIVQYLGSKLTDDALSIYIEYVPNGSVHKLLSDNGPFEEPRIRNYTAQILCGLTYLHQKKTVHRDIKGANILVGLNDEIKLADFGTAKIISSFAEIHSTRGTAQWMAPELIVSSFSGKGYNRAVDIWSLGCTIIEMATARPPWHQHEEPIAAMFKIARNNEIPEIPESLSEEGKSFLQHCLNRDPASRYTATQLMGLPFVKDHPAVRATSKIWCIENHGC